MTSPTLLESLAREMGTQMINLHISGLEITELKTLRESDQETIANLRARVNTDQTLIAGLRAEILELKTKLDVPVRSSQRKRNTGD